MLVEESCRDTSPSRSWRVMWEMPYIQFCTFEPDMHTLQGGSCLILYYVHANAGGCMVRLAASFALLRDGPLQALGGRTTERTPRLRGDGGVLFEEDGVHFLLYK